MEVSKLAILGGDRSLKTPLKKYNSLGVEEIVAVNAVMKSGLLSDFIGADGDNFLGGPKVKSFEKLVEKHFKVKHAISVNSWTSGLICAVGALDLEPGDEIIVPPFTMCATATAVLIWNCIPVFADIEPDMFCLQPEAVERKITDRTKAIIAVDLFGQTADMAALKEIAERYDIKLINDAAQSPNSQFEGNFTGCMSDIGGFSLNYHKHIHCGEGGVIVTNDDELALRMRMIRNHGEAAQEGLGTTFNSIFGFNFRMGEIEAAIAYEQIKKIDVLVSRRRHVALSISKALDGIPGIKLPLERKNGTHVYYLYPIILEDRYVAKREKIIQALEAEGVFGFNAGYQLIYNLPLYQKKLGYGKNQFPWSIGNDIDYRNVDCPNAEYLHNEALICFEICLYQLEDEELNALISAVKKVFSQIEIL